MKTIRNLKALEKEIRTFKRKGKTIGFVPTMGAFHEGHLSLIRKAWAETDCVVVSIFVNPIQFNRTADLRSYPHTLRRDAALARKERVDLLFVPTPGAMYPADFQTSVEVSALSQPLEGAARPGHLQGVTTVVTKLFNLVQPDVTYFGQKDAQQARVVSQLIKDLNFPIRLKILPTVREKGGLAMSSRNRRLSSSTRRSSGVLFDALQEARRLIEWGERRGFVVSRRMREVIRLSSKVRVDYATVVDPKTLKPVRRLRGKVWILLAVRIGKVRLIDSCVIHIHRNTEREDTTETQSGVVR